VICSLLPFAREIPHPGYLIYWRIRARLDSLEPLLVVSTTMESLEVYELILLGQQNRRNS
jgi:hypothetical protein